MTAPTPDGYFDAMWATGDDPWSHGSRWYEARKYDLTVASLLRPRYASAFEPGCGAGFLTERLAARCDRLVATERAERGVLATRERCASWRGVEVRQAMLPGGWPAGVVDLVVLSEVLYYLDDAGLDAVLGRCVDLRAAGAEVVAVHYRRPVPEHVRLGDAVHDHVRAALGGPSVRHLEEAFVLEVFGDAPSG